MKYVLTILPTLKKSAFKELKAIDESINIKHLDFDIFVAETDKSDFTRAVKDSIFVRHIHPVNKELDLTGVKESDLNGILFAVLDFADVTGKSFMVQCRKVGKDLPYNSKDIEVFVGSNLEQQLKGKTVFDDNQIISDPAISVVSILVMNKS